jgi:hypothetical protein
LKNGRKIRQLNDDIDPMLRLAVLLMQEELQALREAIFSLSDQMFFTEIMHESTGGERGKGSVQLGTSGISRDDPGVSRGSSG